MRTVHIDSSKLRGRHIDVTRHGEKVGYARIEPDGTYVVLEDGRCKRMVMDTRNISISIGGVIPLEGDDR